MIYRKFFLNTLVSVVSLILIFCFIEISLRIKNNYIIDYDIEMWKYAKKLKIKSNEKKINHLHRKSSHATLQNVKININSIGMRGNDLDLDNWDFAQKKILFIGSSITLGWGVEESLVQNKILEKIAKKNDLEWATLNGGVGNYNTERYIANFFLNYKDLKPDLIILQYFINDAEILNSNDGNFFTRNFHLGVYFWKFISKLKSDIAKENIFSYYEKVYLEEKKNQIVKNNLYNFKKHCNSENIRCLIVYMPDLNLIDSIDKLDFARNYILNLSNEINLEYIDLTDYFKNYKDNQLTNSEYNDRHPSSFAHDLIAQKIFKYLVN